MEGAAGFSKLEEDITCSVCLQELTDPVSITCGHTFCRACIASYWDTVRLQGYRCPECWRICPKDQLIPAYRLQHLVTKVQLGIEEQAKQEKMVLENEAPASAVPLVSTDPQGRLQLDESAVQSYFLKSEISGYRLCLICVIGETRKGKSTLMNYILRALHSLERGQPVSLGELNDPLTGFEWSIGMDGLTKGIWMWKRPFILERDGNKMAVFVLDTEGSLDIENDRETSIKLSALSMLLSSYLIFNVNANLKTTELDYLEMYLHVAEVVGKSYSLQHLQHLDILIRDWYNPNNCGREAARTYIEHQKEKLRNHSGHARVLQTLNRPSVSGFVLPHPGMQFPTSTGTLADMDDDFRSHLTRYISDLMEEIWQHRKTDTSGRQITCADFGGKLKDFVSVLQNKHYGFGSPIEMLYAFENHKKKNDTIKICQEFMQEETPSSIVGTLRITTSKLRNKLTNETNTRLDEYKNSLKGDESKKQQLVDELRDKLMQDVEESCTEHSRHYKNCAVGVGLAVGGVVLCAAGGVVGGVIAGTVLAAELIAVVAVGGSAVGVIGGGLSGSRVYRFFVRKQNNQEGEDTQHLINKEDDNSINQSPADG